MDTTFICTLIHSHQNVFWFWRHLAYRHLVHWIANAIMICSVTNDKNSWEPVKKQKENPAGCAGEGKQRKGNTGEEKRMVYYTKFEFYDESTRWMSEGTQQTLFIL